MLVIECSNHQVIEVHPHTEEEKTANDEWSEETLEQKYSSVKHFTLTYQSQGQFVHDNWYTQKIVLIVSQNVTLKMC